MILRSKLLTTLINNDVSEKLNAGGRLSALDKFQARCRCFSRPDRRRNKAPGEELVDKENLTSRRRKRCPLTATFRGVRAD
jgi:hypothetical protein